MTTFSVLCLGTLGVGLRYFADLVLRSSTFPLATFTVNVLGCFIAGWIFSQQILGAVPKTAALVGFCGGLTTFSAMIIQSLELMKNGEYLKAIFYLLISQLAGLLAAYVGMKIAHI